MDIILDNVLISTIQANSQVSQMLFFRKDAVHDELRGYLVHNSNSWSFIGVHQYHMHLNKKINKKLALVLESPHKNEYDSNFIPLRPANGKTGNNINTKICGRNFINGLNPTFDYEVLIMNPIQLQCSCYYWFKPHNIKCTSQNTQKVFRCLFNKHKGNLRNDFIYRLRSYHPCIVINCATYALKPVVKTAIFEALPQITYSTDIHPSAW